MKSTKKNKKLKQKGWIVNDKEPYNNLPRICPKCGSILWYTNALALCNIFLVGCKNTKCRWSEIYEM